MILETVLRNVLADAIDTEINTGAGTAELHFETSADAEVATIALQNPAFGPAATGVITLQGVPLSDTSATGGTTTQASIYDRDATKQLEMTVGTSGTEIIISDNVILATDQVDLNSLTITVPAS
jgi:molybdopterin-binding protein